MKMRTISVKYIDTICTGCNRCTSLTGILGENLFTVWITMQREVQQDVQVAADACLFETEPYCAV